MRLTRRQVESRKAQAVRFVREVLGDPDRAAEIERESVEDYAARRRIQILNPKGRMTMPRKTIEDYRAEIADLKEQLAESEETAEALQDQLDEVAAIVAPAEEEEEEDEDDDAGEE